MVGPERHGNLPFPHNLPMANFSPVCILCNTLYNKPVNVSKMLLWDVRAVVTELEGVWEPLLNSPMVRSNLGLEISTWCGKQLCGTETLMVEPVVILVSGRIKMKNKAPSWCWRIDPWWENSHFGDRKCVVVRNISRKKHFTVTYNPLIKEVQMTLTFSFMRLHWEDSCPWATSSYQTPDLPMLPP